jgi:outer membrane phospholipase A
MQRSKRLEYHLFNGMIYRLYPSKTCSEDDQCLLELEVDYKKSLPEKKETAEPESSKKEEASSEKTPSEKTPSEKTPSEKAPSEKTPEELALEAKELNERLSRWVYVIPRWQHRALITDLDPLLAKSEKKKGKGK